MFLIINNAFQKGTRCVASTFYATHYLFKLFIRSVVGGGPNALYAEYLSCYVVVPTTYANIAPSVTG